MRVLYTDGFDFAAEVESICGPLAEAVAADPVPTALDTTVSDLVDAVHRVVLTVGDLLAECDARRKVAHLRNPAEKARATKLFVAARDRTPCPETDELLVSGGWAAVLVDHARPVTDPLRSLLGRSLPPDSNELRGQPSVSEQIEEALREIDRAALSLERRLTRRHYYRKSFTKASMPRPDAATEARRELEKLGLQP